MSSRGASGPTSNAGKLTDRSSADVGTVTSTLMVRNLPFEANKKEVLPAISTRARYVCPCRMMYGERMYAVSDSWLIGLWSVFRCRCASSSQRSGNSRRCVPCIATRPTI